MDKNFVMPKFILTSGEDLTLQDPNTVIKNLKENTAPTQKELDRLKRIESININILSGNYSVIKNEVSYLNLEDLFEPTDEWFIFKRISEEERFNLKYSIMHYGLFTPLIVWERANGKYMILSGIERASVYTELHEEAIGDLKERFKKIPCFVMEPHEINDVMARIIRVDSNLCTRSMDVVSKNKALITKYCALKYFKKRSRDLNILDELSESFNMSRTGITNHLATLKVIEDFLRLFQDGKLSLKSIRKLSKFSKEEQKRIYDGIGMDKIKEIQIATLSEEGVNNPKRLDMSIDILKDMKVPVFSSLKINLPTKFLKEGIQVLENFLRKNIGLQMKIRKPRGWKELIN